MRTALFELGWLLSRAYAHTAAVKVVGDRHGLRKRQRLALYRAACSDQQRVERGASRITTSDLVGQHVAVDGFNCIITFEAMISGGVIFIGRDEVRRDLASVHGSYRQVEETHEAIDALAQVLRPAAQVTWLLDQPVSNSGRLAERLRQKAAQDQLPWTVDVVHNPDRELVALTDVIVATSDSWILDNATRWVDLSDSFEHEKLWLIDLRAGTETRS